VTQVFGVSARLPHDAGCPLYALPVPSEGTAVKSMPWPNDHKARRAGIAVLAVVVLMAVIAVAVPARAVAEQASQPGSPAAGLLDVSGGAVDSSGHTCALAGALGGGGPLRCWGFGGDGRLGYGNASTIGDDETPGAVAPVDLGRAATAITAGAVHSCGLLDDASVRCWGFGGEGRLGYSNLKTVGDDEPPGSEGAVDLGGPTTAISAGSGHSCALLTGGSVRCWGFGADGRLGYGDTQNIGDNEKPSAAGPVDLGGGAAKAVTAGENHTCAVLVAGGVRCWGVGDFGALGYGNRDDVGNDETPGEVDPVELGGPATAITVGDGHTCAILDGGSVRCWGFGANGRLGYGNTDAIGDTEKPGPPVGPVNLGGPAKAISAGDTHTCAILDGGVDDGGVRCWGFGGNGRLGYANTIDVGDDEAPGSVGPVDLGPGRKAKAISAGGRHTCALLDDDSVRCWGEADLGRLGYCNTNDIGDDEAPGSVGPVNVTGSSFCPPPPLPPPGPGGGGAAPLSPAPPTSPAPASAPKPSAAERRRALYRRAFAAQAARKRALGRCDAKVRRHAAREQREVGRRGPAGRRARAKRHIRRHLAQGRRACRKRHGRTPGPVTRLAVRSVSKSKVVLSFNVPGTDGRKPPAARTYVIKQSRRPIRGSRGFVRAQTLCRGRCRFNLTLVGAKATLTVRDLRPNTTYYYSVAALDNVSERRGPRSPNVKARTRR